MELENLPLLIKDLNPFTFDFFDRNVFYAIGETNEAFEASNESVERNEEYKALEGEDGLNSKAKTKRPRFSFEKFFISNEETFQSETMSYIDLSIDPNEHITHYEISQSHDLAAIITNCQNLYIFSLLEMHANFLKK